MAKSPDKGKKKKRPKFCPNAAKKFNLNSSRSNSRLHSEAEEELKRNNAELARSLNLHKVRLYILFWDFISFLLRKLSPAW